MAKTKKEDWPRVHAYGEVARVHTPEHTIVVRGIWKARGDLYHARLMKGRLEEGERDGRPLWSDDFHVESYESPQDALNDALNEAEQQAARKRRRKRSRR